MPAVIEFCGILARIENGVWSCPDPELAAMLQREQAETMVGQVPDHDYACALAIAEQLSGEVIANEWTEPPKVINGRIY